MARRHFQRHKSFSLINILGLSTGIAACLLIYGYVHHQQSFDNYHPKADRIVRVTTVFHSPDTELAFATSNTPLAGALIRDCPQVENAVRIQNAEMTVKQGTVIFQEDNFAFSEQAIFSIFYFSFLEGAPATALTEPNSIVLTKSTARKYFGDGEAMGRILICDKHSYKVTAVIADRPANSDMTIDALVWKDFQSVTSWMDNDFEVYTFVLFRGRPDLTALRKQLAVISATYIQPELEKMEAAKYQVRFTPELLADVHFSKRKIADTPKGNRLFNTIFSVLAIFILIIAILNYINLSTARAEQRAKEVAVRKVAGAKPVQLMGQFLGESVFLMAIAWLLAIMMAETAIPFFNKMLSTRISLGDGGSVFFLFLLFFLTTLLAGAWPAFVLSRFQPVKVLKGMAVQSKGIGLRKVLTVTQFIIALAMLMGTAVIYRQMHFVLHKDLGADRSQVICLSVPRDSIASRRIMGFSQAVQQISGVRGVSVGSGIPVEGVMMSSTTVRSAGMKREILCNYFFIDAQFVPLLHIRLAEGRNLSDSIRMDPKEGFIVNEAFVRAMGWQHGEGQSIEGYGRKGKVVGVVKDFFFKSLHNAIEPAVMIYHDSARNASAVLAKASPSALPRLKETWARYFPSNAFDYYFLDESFDAQYKEDRITMTLFNGFTLLAIFISCLGLYGLVSLITVRRTREIGIRKVLGASGRGLILLLTREFFLLIGWAALVALPLAWWGLHRWLSSYAYHTAFTVDLFVAPLLLLALITLSVTGLRVVRAVLANPVESLRTE
ncbi:ABC transporter permease [Flavitalea sp. BT771]|uniref:ABC transporter permease n=1 Tax=Flavitalea sp. BT771 TaxID=3063329 RepID=UPI0026E3B589|nr:ABC transporter permease [Flavitalea sp. BT771]MDO6433845.1 ABC transporter permease [Flavitalea sp. BT771]MDV6222250.1 FtsX-like permease family protein [Flavitalea sp. BT771]